MKTQTQVAPPSGYRQLWTEAQVGEVSRTRLDQQHYCLAISMQNDHFGAFLFLIKSDFIFYMETKYRTIWGCPGAEAEPFANCASSSCKHLISSSDINASAWDWQAFQLYL